MPMPGGSIIFSSISSSYVASCPEGFPADPDATAVPKWHTAEHLLEKKGIFPAGPIWNVPFHACAITRGTLMTEMRLPQKGSQKAVESSGLSWNTGSTSVERQR
jgi:hypothetical protein